jgi:RNA polymerase sigma-70 factor (ECF subfamily)
MATELDDDFGALFERHRDAVFRFLWRLSRNSADAEDLLQETFLTVWRKREQFAGRGAVEGWLKKAAFRTFLNERTKRQRRGKLDAANGPPTPRAPEPPADHAVIQSDAAAFMRARVEEAIAALPEEPRTAFLLFRFEGMTAAQIGAFEGIPAKTAETRIRRATELLAQQLARYRQDLPGDMNVREQP